MDDAPDELEDVDELEAEDDELEEVDVPDELSEDELLDVLDDGASELLDEARESVR